MSADTSMSPSPDPTTAAASPKQVTKRRSLVATTVGNLLEYYEWAIYAVLAPFIAAAFFDGSDPASALLSTLAVFAVGFLSRPLGGLVFGRIADKKGRKFVLIATMLTMSGCSLAIGLIPTYASIGVWASVLLLAFRVLQGFAQGGESGAASSYVSEIAPSARRGLWSSLIFVTMLGGSVAAYSIGGGVTTALSEEAMAAWGWRVPFLLGGVLALFVIYLRRNLEESDVFTAPPLPAQTDTPTRGTFVRVVLVVAMISGLTVAHYTWSSYMSTYAIAYKGMDAGSAFWALMSAQIIAIFTVPLWGMLSDRIGRRPIWIGFAVLMIALAIPLRGMVTDNPWTLFVPATIVLILVCGPASIMAATMSEAFPTRIRTQGVGFAYAFAVAAFGGSAPYLNALFMERGVESISSIYIMALCVVSIVAVSIMKETRNADLRHT